MYLVVDEDCNVWTIPEITDEVRNAVDIGIWTVIRYVDGKFQDMDYNGNFNEVAPFPDLPYLQRDEEE